ncbi:hypothetical protein [Cellulomonas fimi]|uniref:Uncharacterized protein n=1 Tax=Cellulomonas fimi (strain ATCC 484 / DSM 20113 / JCM 1341 / CCUG 24087 / LMG 16345 / NBRC 15513 / NCIMB 8980 / NCTC 7547 / NRS-133) TaxID=590998 RepID=F4H6A8_CELFA|nr:hypothetical protein [Cellulomonas fimi]AEE44420.1 hypothetical protein Celf_0275 [Cellulomonas fimi ATCC 484]NNH08311.1 hypothetical protein [Cellulomonas fimi]VEH26326.1 Ubp3 associated protein Bre5 [Cellulomonas fimi]
MAERICEVCGTANPPTAEFCRTCDTYFGWDGEHGPPGGTTAPGSGPASTPGSGVPGATGPVVTGTSAAGPGGGATTGGASAGAAAAAAGATTGPAATGGATATTEPRPEERAEVPVVSPDAAAVVVGPGSPGTFTLSLKNASPVVDGIVVHAQAPPPWLDLTHDDANLMPGEARTVTVTLAQRAGTMVAAQTVTVPLLVRSSLDPSKAAPVAVQVTVPRYGPPPTATARPHLLQLQDATEGTFTVTLDNRAANFPRHYRLAVQDAEDVVRADVVPPSVDVPAGEAVDVRVRFTAPAPAPGREATRQLTVEGSDEDGPVSAAVTVVQRTSPEVAPEPFTVRMEPSHLRAEGDQAVAFDVIVDNRAASEAVAVELAGRDPQRLVAFSFGHAQFVVPGGKAMRVHALARTAPPAPGTSASRPFSVVVTDGEREVESPGLIDVTASASPITTARLQVHPATLTTAARTGTYTVDVDNRAGASPLQVQLSAADEMGRARLAFSQDRVSVPAGQVGRVQLRVDSPLPDGGTTASRGVRVVATDGTRSVEAQATFTQTARDWRPVVKRWLVWLGAIAVIAGAVLPWTAGEVVDLELVVEAAAGGDTQAVGLAAAIASTLLVAVLALVMLMGLNGSGGRLIRGAAILIALLAVAALVVEQSAIDRAVVTTGVPIILLGAVLGFVGGVFARPRGGR